MGASVRFIGRLLWPFRHIEQAAGWWSLIPHSGWVAGVILGAFADLPVVWMVTLILTSVLVLASAAGYGLQAEFDKLTSDVRRAIEFLDSRAYQIVSNRVTLADILVWLRKPFLRGIDRDYIATEIRRAMGFGSPEISQIGIPQDEILADLLQADLLEWKHIDPAPGAPSSIRFSIHDVAHDRYSLNSLGKKVIGQLEARPTPSTPDKAGSLRQ